MLFTVVARYVGQSEFVVDADDAQSAKYLFDAVMDTCDGSTRALMRILSDNPADNHIEVVEVTDIRTPEPFLALGDFDLHKKGAE